jgi:hypothetical protein
MRARAQSKFQEKSKICLYVHISSDRTTSRHMTTYLASYQTTRTTRRKIFWLLWSDNSKKNILTTLSSTSSTTSSSTAACYAWGLAAVHSRKLSTTLEGSTSTHLWVRKLILKTCDFVDMSNKTNPNSARGLDNNFASDRGCDSMTTTRLPLQLDYAAPTMAHPIKAKFSSSKSQLSFTFAAPDTRGLRHEKSSCISLI